MFRRHRAIPDEAIFLIPRKPPERHAAYTCIHDQQRSSVMWDQFFSLIYRLSCRTTLIEIGAHRLAR
ncbi:hypothetical protein [Bradyrhizobium liaoningense]|uniref:hypothetical protein n=1 Tax=Bradyrhizobium liaoningense TaxID=43992 RepID=UPI0004B6FEE9|nr:hypothetical protein [Bradyrhizobium liaoningense]